MSLARVGMILVTLIGAIVAVYAFYQAVDERSAPPIVIEDVVSELPIAVDVRGAVSSPGVYELPAGARMQDVIRASGGLAPEADLSTVNLARRLRDGEVIFILTTEDAITAPDVPGAESASAPDADASPPVNINTASIAELDVLPGIGEVTARRIIEFREVNGPYRSIDDLVHIEGISSRSIEALRDLVTAAP